MALCPATIEQPKGESDWAEKLITRESDSEFHIQYLDYALHI
jgi:hypothetical protein